MDDPATEQAAKAVKARPRRTPFQRPHLRIYGLKVTILGLDGQIETVECRFCVVHWNDECLERRKRKRTEMCQQWIAPFRPEYCKKHNETQHAELWG